MSLLYRLFPPDDEEEDDVVELPESVTDLANLPAGIAEATKIPSITSTSSSNFTGVA
jgi:hypothetical protein